MCGQQLNCVPLPSNKACAHSTQTTIILKWLWMQKPKKNVLVSLLSKQTLKHINYFSTRCIQVCLGWVESKWIWPQPCSPQPRDSIIAVLLPLKKKEQLKLQHTGSILVATDESELEFSQTVMSLRFASFSCSLCVGLETEKQRVKLTEASRVPRGLCSGPARVQDIK